MLCNQALLPIDYGGVACVRGTVGAHHATTDKDEIRLDSFEILLRPEMV